jgi:hypothetical protein
MLVFWTSLMATSCFLMHYKLAIIMCLTFKEKLINPLFQVSLIDDDFKIALEFFCFKHQKGSLCYFGIFPFSLKKIWEKKTSQHIVLTLDLRFKNLHLVSSFIDFAKSVSITEKYDRWPLHPMLLQRYCHLHPITKFEVGCIEQTFDEDSNLNILNKLPTQMN